MLPKRITLFTINLALLVSILMWLHVDSTHGMMKKKMFRKLKSMLTHKAKKLIILPIPIPFMMEDKKFGGGGGLGLLGGTGGHMMMPSMNQGMDSWMMMSMMDCPEMMMMGDNHNPVSFGMGSSSQSGGKDAGKTYFTGPGSYGSIPSGHQPPQQESVDSWGNMPNRGLHGQRGGSETGNKGSSASAPGRGYFKGQTKEMGQMKLAQIGY